MTRSRMAFRRPRLARSAALVLLALPSPAAAQGATIAGKFENWSLNVSDGAVGKICYVAAEPKERKPANASRAGAAFYVSAWPQDGVKSEVSVKIGFAIKAGSKVAVTVGKDVFKLFPKEERAFVSDGGQEAKLVAAMKKGQALTVESVPQTGPVVTDTYPLAGFGPALEAMGQSCK